MTPEDEIRKLRALLLQAAGYIDVAADLLADEDEDDTEDAREMVKTCRKAANGELWSLDDPRPEDPAELARAVAVELRKRGIYADFNVNGPVIRLPAVLHSVGDYLTSYRVRCVVLSWSEFDNLGPCAIADAIQADEAKHAQDWAGDSKEALTTE